MMICILGRQPELGHAELASLYGTAHMFSREAALIETNSFDIQATGGIQKAGSVTLEIPHTNWPAVSRAISEYYLPQWTDGEHKITLGISVYGKTHLKSKDINMLGVKLKQQLKKAGGSMRTIPTKDISLNTAVSHHNKLGLSPNKVELLIVQADGKTIVAQSTGAQNITALAKRDQGRPKRDAFVGMLPPKLALMMLNMAVGTSTDPQKELVLDPFCGTGVILQEAMLRGYNVYGSDLSDKMIDFTEANLTWLERTHHTDGSLNTLHQADATTAKWQRPHDITAVVCESYLGQPFSATPSSTKLREVQGNCNAIISNFLKNIGAQVRPGTVFTVAVPAWRNLSTKYITRLPLVHHLEDMGFTSLQQKQLLYYREDQVVARDILCFKKA
ncbi:MAG: TRM11 family SAM-dependent methyltransferase [Candidatus Saccharimonadales bacterium]